MASLTIRKLDETVKAYLRLRSAHHGGIDSDRYKLPTGRHSRVRRRGPPIATADL